MNPTVEALEDFNEEMMLVLEGHSAEKGASWRTCSIAFLEQKLREEVGEYFDETNPGKKARETVDIANICMMLWMRQRKNDYDNAIRRRARRGEEDD